MPFKRQYIDIAERMLSHVIIKNNCWEWQGAKNNSGYGRINFRIKGKVKCCFVHRVSFENYKRPLNDGEEIDHLCFNRLCINPEHLQATTKLENLKRRRKNVSQK